MSTIADVAKLAKTSKSSVSRVLNGNFDYMSEELKQRIQSAIAELQYTPNSLAQNLKKKKTQMIGIILSDISNPFWSEVLRGVQKECNRNGYGLMVTDSNEDPETELENVQLLRSRQVDGLIVNTSGSNPKMYKGLIKENFPFVLLDRYLEGMKADTVVVNNTEGAKGAIQYLIGLGHRRIAILLHTLGKRSPRIERLEGYKLAHTLRGLPLDESLIKICKPSRGAGVKATGELLAMENPPTAIFATNEALNLEVLAGIKTAGKKVPADVSVVGYDDFPWIPMLDPPLSTVAQPAFDMGVKAASLLVDNITGNRKGKPQTIQLEPELIIRDSCIPRAHEGGDEIEQELLSRS